MFSGISDPSTVDSLYATEGMKRVTLKQNISQIICENIMDSNYQRIQNILLLLQYVCEDTHPLDQESFSEKLSFDILQQDKVLFRLWCLKSSVPFDTHLQHEFVFQYFNQIQLFIYPISPVVFEITKFELLKSREKDLSEYFRLI